MRWTRQFRKTSEADADGEAVWALYPDADINVAMMLRITRWMVTRKPDRRLLNSHIFVAEAGKD